MRKLLKLTLVSLMMFSATTMAQSGENTVLLAEADVNSPRIGNQLFNGYWTAVTKMDIADETQRARVDRYFEMNQTNLNAVLGVSMYPTYYNPRQGTVDAGRDNVQADYNPRYDQVINGWYKGVVYRSRSVVCSGGTATECTRNGKTYVRGAVEEQDNDGRPIYGYSVPRDVEGANAAASSRMTNMVKLWCESKTNNPHCFDGRVVVQQRMNGTVLESSVRIEANGQARDSGGFIHGIRNAEAWTWQNLSSILGGHPLDAQMGKLFTKKHIPINLRLMDSVDSWWRDAYWRTKMVHRLNELSGNLGFSIQSIERESNPALQHVNLSPILNAYDETWRSTNQVNIAVTGYRDTNHYWGLTFYPSSGLYEFDVLIAMTQFAKWQPNQMYQDNAIDHIARIILHEIGHSLSLTHEGGNNDSFYHEGNPMRYRFDKWGSHMNNSFVY